MLVCILVWFVEATRTSLKTRQLCHVQLKVTLKRFHPLSTPDSFKNMSSSKGHFSTSYLGSFHEAKQYGGNFTSSEQEISRFKYFGSQTSSTDIILMKN